ncbi:MAG TPA: GAF domain-containing protein [Trebonia sp.]
MRDGDVADARADPTAAFGRVYLDLLNNESPVAEFERPILEACAAGATPGVLAELEAAKLVALHVRSEIEERRRREAELAALFDTATDLAALHDLDSVLRAIVRRARLLLGSDMAYLTLHDPSAGDTYMRVTAGSVSADFQHVRLGMGEGLGGLVAERAAPYATASYFTDERLRHTPAIDRAVREECLVSILGVPLVLSKSVIGVLFAGDRRTRTFAAQDVSLLCSLAAHAAIAIDAANLLEDTRRTLDELNTANELLKEQKAAVERASQAHKLFTELVLSGGQAEDIACAVAAVLGSDVVILGEHDNPVAVGGRPPLDDPGLTSAVARARAARRAVCAETFWAVPATAGPEYLGTLALRSGPDLPEGDRLILERAAMVTALLLLQGRSVVEAEQRVRGELLGDLLDAPHQDTESLRARGLRLGVDLDRPHLVVVVHAEPELWPRLRAAAAHLAATRHGLASDHDGRTVLLLPGTDPAAAGPEVAASLSHAARGSVTVGAAGPSGCPSTIVAAYSQACRCVEALLALGRQGAAATLGELGFLGLLLSDHKDVPGFIRSVIGCLLDYDTRKGTDLVQTVEAYFSSGGNVTKAKDALHVHVNTVTQRLDRITSLLGEDWQLGERALEIRLAVYLYRLRARGRAS